jgi:SAM-dependent methyltransferase
MKYGNRGTFILGNIADDSIPNCGQFDIVCAIGVLHHLPEKDAVKLIDDGVKLLKEGGRLITLDNINEDYVGVVNKIALKLDRGAYIRNKDDYLKLFSKYHDIRFTIKKAPMRIPYYHIICELIKRP